MTAYRSTDQRLYVCLACGSPERAPVEGGQVSCSRCQTVNLLPSRSAVLSNSPTAQMPDDPARLQHLRAQDGRPRPVPPTLQAVLGGTSLEQGREEEALAIWQSLRARSCQGDAAASEDMTVLTLMMAQSPTVGQTPQLGEALCESAYDAAVLPRHKQELLGRLARRASGHGDRAAAHRYLSWMVTGAPDLESDSELRVSMAALATLDRDGQRVLSLLGARKDVVPIADSMDALASVFRANAHELLGDPAMAVQTLRELPDPQLLTLVAAQFSSLDLCPQARLSYSAATMQEAAKRAASSAAATSTVLGPVFAITGVALLVGSVQSDEGRVALGILGGIFLLLGIAAIMAARVTAKRAAWLRVNGTPLTARILSAQRTGTTIGDVPVHRFALQVAGPQGPYAATFDKLVSEHQVAAMVGGEVRIRANPSNLQEIVPED